MPLKQIIEIFKIQQTLLEGIEPSSNIFPSEEIAAIIVDDKKKLVKFKWGFVPSWAKNPPKGYINARAETINQKPFFRESFRKRRAIIISDGFYEWDKRGKEKTPILIRMKNGDPLLLAGVYDFREAEDGRKIGTCAIITTVANDLLKGLHDRMPVIIKKKDAELWLDNSQDENLILSLLRPFDSDELELIPGKFEEEGFNPFRDKK